MHLLAHGLDLVACRRIEQALHEHGDRLLDRLLTQVEKNYIASMRNPVPHLAGRFAAKEAILKALGTGWRGPIAWTDMEIVNDRGGQPVCRLSGEVARIAAERGIQRMLVSITHTDEFAAATALALGPADSR